VVDVASAPEGDLVMRERAALGHRRSLGVGIGLRFRTRMRDFTDVDWLSVVNWSDHCLVL
jgi:hypothetical protein